MKRILLILIALFTFGMGNVFAQPDVANKGRDLPNATLEDLEGAVFNAADIDNEGKPIIVAFWATWCKPCILELETIMDEYEDWQDETGVKLIAISVDDARNKHKVAPMANGREWDYEVYIDQNQDFKRAMNVANVPHAFVLDADKKIVWQHPGFQAGDEEHLFEVVKAVAKGEPIPGSDHAGDSGH